jgi:hypothetical protein
MLRRRVSPSVVVALAVGAAATGAVVVSFPPGRPVTPTGPADPAVARAVPSPGSYPTEPLSPGTPAPKVEAAGWINGPPEPAPKLVLLDIWSGW